MNAPQQNVEQTAEHEGLIKTPKQLIITVVLAFIIPIVVIMLLIRLVTASTPMGQGSDAQTQEAVARRIQPVAGFSLVSADAAAAEKTGEQVYAATCSACHGTGVAGAPKLGDTAAWKPLIDKGFETLVKNAINGINAMPPRGGNPALSDLEVARAVAHIANQSGGDFAEPEAPAEGAAADAGGQGGSAPAAAQAEAAPAAAAAQAAAASNQKNDEAAAGQQGGDHQQAAQQQQAAAVAAAGGAGQQAAEAAAQQAPAQQGAAEAPAAAANIDLAAGENLYKRVCFACHNVGVAGAPKVGDKAAWAPLIAAGMDHMVKIAIEGKGAMPPRGGSTASDDEVIAAVHYMVNASQ